MVAVMQEKGEPKRDAKGRLLPGQRALNPYGVDRRKLQQLRSLEGLTPKAIKTLERLLDDANPSAALGAAKEILDRNLGKVKQQVQVDVTSTHVLHLQALEELAARKKQQLIESQAIDITEHGTLDRIVSHGDSGSGVTIEGEGVAVPGVSGAGEPPRPPEHPGAAAYAPSPLATDENQPTIAQDDTP
jgi:hypothetical protein